MVIVHKGMIGLGAMVAKVSGRSVNLVTRF